MAAHITGPLKLRHCVLVLGLGNHAFEHNLFRMTFWASYGGWAQFWFFRLAVVPRLVNLHHVPNPRERNVHNLHADTLIEMRSHRVHSSGLLFSHEERNSRSIKEPLQLECV